MRRQSFWISLRVASAGFIRAVREERNLWLHLAAALLAVLLAAALRLPVRDWAVLWLTLGLVIATELINTALEDVVDLASPEYHELAKRAKDTAAGAVVLAALSALLVGLCLFGPPLLQRLGLV